MDHQEALSMQAVERYTLGELTSPQREDFEEHFFDCPQCAAALREFESFAANARAVFQEEEAAAKELAKTPVAPPRPEWWRQIRDWFGMGWMVPASAVAVLVIAFVLFRTPASGPTVAFNLSPDVRGEVATIVVASGASWLAPSIDLLPRASRPNRWAHYQWEIRSVADDRILAQDKGQDGGDKLTLKIEASKFESGKEYRLIVRGDPANAPETAGFVIMRQ